MAQGQGKFPRTRRVVYDHLQETREASASAVKQILQSNLQSPPSDDAKASVPSRYGEQSSINSQTQTNKTTNNSIQRTPKEHVRQVNNEKHPDGITTEQPLIATQPVNPANEDCVDAKDNVDGAPQDMTFTILDAGSTLVSLVTYLIDVGSDIFLAYYYFTHGHFWWFIMTTTFVAVPSLTMSLFGMRWYVQDFHFDKRQGRVSRFRWISRFTLAFLQLGPVIRYLDTFVYGCKSRCYTGKLQEQKRRHWYIMMLYEDTDSALLRLFECFMESSPQLVLQLYIMTRLGFSQGMLIVGGQAIAIATSLGSLAWSLCAYQRALRFSLPDKANVTFCGMALVFFWHFFILAARVVAMAMFASVFRVWIFSIVAAHWAMMFFWIIYGGTKFCPNKLEEIFFDIVAALVYIFCFFNIREGHTRLQYAFYYLVVYLENAAMVISWYMVTRHQSLWYHYPMLNIVLIGFLIGLAIQLVYYGCMHPNNQGDMTRDRRIRTWLTWEEMIGSRNPATKKIGSLHELCEEMIEIEEEKRKSKIKVTTEKDDTKVAESQIKEQDYHLKSHTEQNTGQPENVLNNNSEEIVEVANKAGGTKHMKQNTGQPENVLNNNSEEVEVVNKAGEQTKSKDFDGKKSQSEAATQAIVHIETTAKTNEAISNVAPQDIESIIKTKVIV